MVPLEYEDGTRIRDENADERDVREAHARWLLAKNEEAAKGLVQSKHFGGGCDWREYACSWLSAASLDRFGNVYSEAVYRRTSDAFIQCIENAFHYFGGVPKRLLIDNLKAAVSKADW